MPDAPTTPSPSPATAALSAALDVLPQGALLIADGMLRAASPAARERLALDADPGRLDATRLFARPADATAVFAGTAFEGNVLLRHADGRTVPVDIVARRLPGVADATWLVLLADPDPPPADDARLVAQREELQMLTRRLMTLQEDERAALSRELHDDIGQAITAIKLCASALQGPGTPAPGLVAETAQEIAQIADQTVVKLRDLSLLLRPPQLDALGLEAALRWQAGRLFRGEAPALSLAIDPLDCRPPREVELACFRIAQEALTNVLRHARAAHVRLQLACDDTTLRLAVEDDGAGMPADGRAGLGLVTMRERAQQLGGTFAITSRPGRTRIEATLPLEPPMAA